VGGLAVDANELTAEIERVHKLISEAADRAKDEGAKATVIDKLSAAKLRIELLLKRLGAGL
jgi:diacylglycerol kinase